MDIINEEYITEVEVVKIPVEVSTYKVYIKTNDSDLVTAVNSSAFLFDTNDWIEIDEGTGDRYYHAQGNYFSNPLIDENGLYNYKLIDGQPMERTAEDKQPELDRLNTAAEIAQLKRKLSETDYIAAKLAEGAATREEYEEQLTQRAAWRFRINELEELYNV